MNQLPKIPGLNILKKIAEGGQGSVYHARRNNTEYALKLYNDHSATPAQRDIIKHLVQAGVPAGGYEDKFAWPLELIEVPGGSTFGYLMRLIDTKAYITLAKVESGRVSHPGYGIMAEAGRQLAGLFRELHIAGYCYGDISKYNFMFSPNTGDVIICDNVTFMS